MYRTKALKSVTQCLRGGVEMFRYWKKSEKLQKSTPFKTKKNKLTSDMKKQMVRSSAG